MQEVIERPRNEYTNGPLVYFEDAGYVLKKTGMGLCDSVNQMTKSISNGISWLTMDEIYIERRR